MDSPISVIWYAVCSVWQMKSYGRVGKIEFCDNIISWGTSEVSENQVRVQSRGYSSDKDRGLLYTDKNDIAVNIVKNKMTEMHKWEKERGDPVQWWWSSGRKTSVYLHWSPLYYEGVISSTCHHTDNQRRISIACGNIFLVHILDHLRFIESVGVMCWHSRPYICDREICK